MPTSELLCTSSLIRCSTDGIVIVYGRLVKIVHSLSRARLAPMASSIRPGVVGSLLFELKFWARYLLPTKYVAVYYPSPPRVVDRMLKLAGCTSADTVFDLGCGDGRVVGDTVIRELVAAGKLGARAAGYELDAELCQAANAAIQQAGLQERCTVMKEDAANADLSTATIVALYLSDRGNRELMNKLRHTLQPRTRIVSNFFKIEGWDGQFVRSCTLDPTTGPIHLYVHNPQSEQPCQGTS